jgi:4-hydroxythreonine-4-phosphate dehydrogenase
MILVSLGDPLSCNVELLAKAWATVKPDEAFVVCGSFSQWKDQLSRLGLSDFPELRLSEKIDSKWQSGLFFVDIDSSPFVKAEDMSAKQRGELSVDALKTCCEFIRGQHEPDKYRLLTCPIDKNAATHAGFGAHGHTEYLAEFFSCDSIMILAGPQLKVALVTNHLALSEVPTAVTKPAIMRKAVLLLETMQKRFNVVIPRIAITGLNPHCSDGGLFGQEERETIEPAIADLSLQFAGEAEFSGVHPADTVFYRAFNNEFDCVLAMYHDQALGPLKTVHFDSAVNVTGGLPFKRVSPDHGPAADLFLTQQASATSFVNALRYLV